MNFLCKSMGTLHLLNNSFPVTSLQPGEGAAVRAGGQTVLLVLQKKSFHKLHRVPLSHNSASPNCLLSAVPNARELGTTLMLFMERVRLKARNESIPLMLARSEWYPGLRLEEIPYEERFIFVFTHLYLVEVLSCFEGHYVVGGDPNYRFVCRIFCFIERQRRLSGYHLQENRAVLSHEHGTAAAPSKPRGCSSCASYEHEPGRPHAGQTRSNSRRFRSAGAESSTAARRARPRWTSPSARAPARAASPPAAPRRAPRPWFRPTPSPADTEAERPRSAPPGAPRERTGRSRGYLAVQAVQRHGRVRHPHHAHGGRRDVGQRRPVPPPPLLLLPAGEGVGAPQPADLQPRGRPAAAARPGHGPAQRQSPQRARAQLQPRPRPHAAGTRRRAALARGGGIGAGRASPRPASAPHAPPPRGGPAEGGSGASGARGRGRRPAEACGAPDGLRRCLPVATRRSGGVCVHEVTVAAVRVGGLFVSGGGAPGGLCPCALRGLPAATGGAERGPALRARSRGERLCRAGFAGCGSTEGSAGTDRRALSAAFSRRPESVYCSLIGSDRIASPRGRVRRARTAVPVRAVLHSCSPELRLHTCGHRAAQRWARGADGFVPAVSQMSAAEPA